ncbi:MAG: TAXI family TRAP transporter solute-binding subunit [Steroidobacteraceae bacterium]
MIARGYWSYFAGMIVILLIASGFIVRTLPPRTIVMTTGPEGSADYEFGVRYREILAQSGVKLQLLPTTGSVENLARLRDPKSGVGVGFIQGGTTTRKESPELGSLGTVFYEPLWFFYRSDIGEGMQALRGRRVSIGPEGSGSRALALELIKTTKIDSIVGEFLGLTAQEAAARLIAADIDAAFIVTAWDSPVVQHLINAKGVTLASWSRADAYLALYPFLNKLVLPAGVVDLLMNRPPTDIVLLAPKASLAVRTDLHPAIQHLLLSAAMQIHSQPGIFQKAGQFPAAESIDIPLSEEAQRFYKSGRPFLQEHLPFWIATLVERVLVVFVPLAFLLYPMVKFLPQMYDRFLRMKITRMYDEMKLIETEMEAQGQGRDANEINAKLDQLDQRASRLSLPTDYASTLYTLRSHIGLIRNRLAMSPDKNQR